MSKILMISPKDNNFYNFRKELIVELLSLNNEVVLVCPYGEKIDYFLKKGCRFIDIDVDRRGKNVIKDLKLCRLYYQLIKNESPDIVLTYTTKPSVYAGFICKILKIPYIVNNAGLMETNGILDIFMKTLYKLAWSKASCIMYQNNQEMNYINNLLKDKVYYRNIPGSGVNLEEFSFYEYPETDDEIIFNYVARIVAIKGIDEFLECAKYIKRDYSNVNFNIYGDFDDDEYRRIIDDYEKQGIVKYCGVVKDIKPYIIKSHAVIHPSYYEGMTNVILEHSAMGRPCIGAEIYGVKEAIDDGETGFVFKVKDVQSMIDAVDKFINLSNYDKANMGKQARKKMEKGFDRIIVTKIYIEEIYKILNRNCNECS